MALLAYRILFYYYIPRNLKKREREKLRLCLYEKYNTVIPFNQDAFSRDVIAQCQRPIQSTAEAPGAQTLTAYGTAQWWSASKNSFDILCTFAHTVAGPVEAFVQIRKTISLPSNDPGSRLVTGLAQQRGSTLQVPLGRIWYLLL